MNRTGHKSYNLPHTVLSGQMTCKVWLKSPAITACLTAVHSWYQLENDWTFDSAGPDGFQIEQLTFGENLRTTGSPGVSFCPKWLFVLSPELYRAKSEIEFGCKIINSGNVPDLLQWAELEGSSNERKFIKIFSLNECWVNVFFRKYYF